MSISVHSGGGGFARRDLPTYAAEAATLQIIKENRIILFALYWKGGESPRRAGASGQNPPPTPRFSEFWKSRNSGKPTPHPPPTSPIRNKYQLFSKFLRIWIY